MIDPKKSETLMGARAEGQVHNKGQTVRRELFVVVALGRYAYLSLSEVEERIKEPILLDVEMDIAWVMQATEQGTRIPVPKRALVMNVKVGQGVLPMAEGAGMRDVARAIRYEIGKRYGLTREHITVPRDLWHKPAPPLNNRPGMSYEAVPPGPCQREMCGGTVLQFRFPDGSSERSCILCGRPPIGKP